MGQGATWLRRACDSNAGRALMANLEAVYTGAATNSCCRACIHGLAGLKVSSYGVDRCLLVAVA
jgi:hypothetical protein